MNEVDGGVLTVRFTYRASLIRIIGAGYWRKGKAIYERENQIQRMIRRLIDAYVDAQQAHPSSEPRV